MPGWGLVLRKVRAADGCVPTRDGGTDQSSSRQQTMPRPRRHISRLSTGRGGTTGFSLRRAQARQRQAGIPQPQQRCHQSSSLVYCVYLPLPSDADRNIGTWVLWAGCHKGKRAGTLPASPDDGSSDPQRTANTTSTPIRGPTFDLHIAPC